MFDQVFRIVPFEPNLETVVVKLYSHLTSGTPSYHNEVSALLGLAERAEKNQEEQEIRTPVLLAHGELFPDKRLTAPPMTTDRALVERGLWPWPFIVSTEVQGIPLFLAHSRFLDSQREICAESLGKWLKRAIFIPSFVFIFSACNLRINFIHPRLLGTMYADHSVSANEISRFCAFLHMRLERAHDFHRVQGFLSSGTPH
jgi:hypothetical protein